jgi:hypothetical protein
MVGVASDVAAVGFPATTDRLARLTSAQLPGPMEPQSVHWELLHCSEEANISDSLQGGEKVEDPILLL